MSRTYIIANYFCEHLDEYAFACKNLYNSTLYEYRQMFFNGEGMISAYDMFDVMSTFDSPLPAKVKQQVIMQVAKNIKSFYANKNAKLPKYLDSRTGRANIILTNQAISRIKFDKENKISFNFQNEMFEYDITNLKNKLQLTFADIKQVRVVYKFKKYQVILVVNEKQKQKTSGSKIMAVDLGLDRIMSVVYGTSKVLFDGKQLKRINHRFNRSLAKLQSERDLLKNQWIKLQCQLEKMDYDAVFYYELSMEFNFNEEKYKKLIRKQSHINNRLKKLEKIIARTYENRNNSCLHWLSRRLIELCVSNGIGKIVIGYNKEWKQDINLGKRTNLNFVQIPHKTLIDYIQYKAAEYVIVVKLQEESYTSKCSFLDHEPIKKHAEYAGKRIHRGLFQSKYGKQIHADINAAYNIAKKAGYDFCLCPSSLCSWPVLKRIDFGNKVS
jgi:putative transposase